MDKQIVKMWVETARPKTLPLAAASIIIGAALAYWDKQFSWQITLLCLITTLLLQILSNFANDYGDYQKGSDTTERIGPLRGIQKGVISASQLKKGIILVILASLFFGCLLIASSYKSYADLLGFSLLGGLAILAAITYTVGAKPYGYMGLGDVSVLLFFGILGVCGTYYLQTHQLNLMVFFPALSTGLFAAAVLNINNLRDIEQDQKVGKNTLAVRLGAKNGRIYHCLLLGIGELCYLIFAFMNFHHLINYIFLLTLPLLIKHVVFVYRSQDPLLLRPMLGQMSMLALLTNLLFSFGLLLN